MEEEGEPPAQALEHIPSHNVLLFGAPSELDGISLPTSFDILKYYFFKSHLKTYLHRWMKINRKNFQRT